MRGENSNTEPTSGDTKSGVTVQVPAGFQTWARVRKDPRPGSWKRLCHGPLPSPQWPVRRGSKEFQGSGPWDGS